MSRCPICSKKLPPKTLYFCPECWWALPGDDRAAIGKLHRAKNASGVKAKVAAIVKGVKKAAGANAKLLVVDAVENGGPFGCRCETMTQRALGDGCDICNPELAKELSEEDAS